VELSRGQWRFETSAKPNSYHQLTKFHLQST
jgi:hypothetical protein